MKKNRSTQKQENSILSIKPIDATIDTPNPLLESLRKTIGQETVTNKKKKIVVIDDALIYNNDKQFTKENYEQIKLQNLRDIYSILANQKTGRQYIYGLANRRSLVDAILDKQEELRNQIKGTPFKTPKKSSIKIDTISNNVEDTIVNDYVIPEVDNSEINFQELQKIDDQYIYNMNISRNIPTFNIDKNETDIDNENELGIIPQDIESKEYNNYLKKKELLEYDDNTAFDELYPTLNDSKFSSRIAAKKEFSQTKYDGTIHNIEEQADKYCNASFELSPNQMFIKNFLSSQTPYNSLLLFHGVGTGKTCSAIGISEEVRIYNMQNKKTQRIIIVASPNVQKNFKLQLFDESKLANNGGYWNLTTCIGQSLIKEINPTNMKDVPRETIIRQINNLIKSHYLFLGYTEFSRFIDRSIKVNSENLNVKEMKLEQIKKIKNLFNNRLLIIDEAHNIRISEDNNKKKIGSLLMKIAKYSNNMKLLLLTATPMYNSYNEILWMTNLLNVNDNRSTISQDEIFNKDGTFKDSSDNFEGGKELLTRKLIGYVSHVRGENPYAFPFRVYPETFEPENKITNYPKVQFNDVEITNPLQHIKIYPHKMKEQQQEIYNKIIDKLKDTQKINMENMQTFGYTILQKPIESTIITYPGRKRVGKDGFNDIMSFEVVNKPLPNKLNYTYNEDMLEKHGPFFKLNTLQNYSIKISSICNIVKKSNGVVLIYSQFIESGIIPIALALEEMGFSRYSSTPGVKSLFKKQPTDLIDSSELIPKKEMLKPSKFKPARYCIITGDPYLSHNNAKDIQYINQPENKDGELVKVYLISKAASEGLDFKNIRQVHVVDPWYNMNRIEQIIGRAVRNKSHCELPFKKRNVEIYLHACEEEKETPDMYLYRLAETKALQIGKITRILKEVSVDCVLNKEQSNFTIDKIRSKFEENKNIEIELTNGELVKYGVGDKPFTAICDFLDNCEYTCLNEDRYIKPDSSTYDNNFIKMNYNTIMSRIKQIFKEHFVLDQDNLIKQINYKKEYPREQIFFVLSQMIDNKNDIINDKYNRNGTLINKGKYYAFQPQELNDENISVLERSIPIDYKHERIIYDGDLIKQKDTTKNQKHIENYSNILNTINIHLDNINKTIPNSSKTIKANSSWYIHATSDLLQDLLFNVNKIPKESFIKYTIYHYLDELSIEDKLIVMKHVYTTKEIKSFVEKIFQEYFENKMVTYKSKNAIVVFDKNIKKNKLFIIDIENNTITPARNIDEENFKIPIAQNFLTSKDKLYNDIGFLSYSRGLFFKLKNMNEKYNNSGAKCGSTNKTDIVSKMHCIINGEMCKPIFSELDGVYQYVYNEQQQNEIKKEGLCIIMENIMRYYDETQYRGKRYFFTLEEAIINQIEKI